ncbi:hypothetical protein ACSQ5K_14865 [Pseudomonas sp. PhalM4]
MIVWQRPNLLLLDEPTNHLDLATREALALALNQFEGSLMLVSHDRALLRSVCDEFWLVGDGTVTDFEGDLEDYRRYLLEQAKKPPPAVSPVETRQLAAKAHKTLQGAAGAEASKQMKALRRQIEEIEKQVGQHAIEKARLENELAANPDYPHLMELSSALETVQSAIDVLEESWLELQEQAERIVNS